MRLVCARPHPRYDSPRDEGTLAFDSVGEWILHQLQHSRWIREKAIKIGFLDCENEYSEFFWRWDYWNSVQVKWLRDHEQREWEKRRARTIAKWGEGSA